MLNAIKIIWYATDTQSIKYIIKYLNNFIF